MKLKKSLLIIICLFAFSDLLAVFIFNPLPTPPKGDEIGEIMFKRTDTSTRIVMNGKMSVSGTAYITMSRSDFLRFFTEGVFYNAGESIEWVYRSGTFKEPCNSTGVWQYCSGFFATKDGRIFSFNRAREGVLEISDVQYRTGFLILPEAIQNAQPTNAPYSSPAVSSKR